MCAKQKELLTWRDDGVPGRVEGGRQVAVGGGLQGGVGHDAACEPGTLAACLLQDVTAHRPGRARHPQVQGAVLWDAPEEF